MPLFRRRSPQDLPAAGPVADLDAAAPGRISDHLADLAAIHGFDAVRLGRLAVFVQRHPNVVADALGCLSTAVSSLSDGPTRRFYVRFQDQLPVVLRTICSGALDSSIEQFLHDRMRLHDDLGSDCTRMFGFCGYLPQAVHRAAVAHGYGAEVADELAR